MTLFVAHKEQFVHLVWNSPSFIITVFSLSSFPIEKFPTENCLRRVSSLANIIPVLKNKAYLANKYYINFLWQSSADSLFLKNWTRTSEYRTLSLWLIFALWDGIQSNILKTGQKLMVLSNVYFTLDTCHGWDGNNPSWRLLGSLEQDH